LNKTGGVIHGPKGAARILALNPNTLRSRIKKLGITVPGTKLSLPD
jgi:formate hydrogenlyase transcriptional activator